MKIKMMTTKNVIAPDAVEKFKLTLGTVATDETEGTYRWNKLSNGTFRPRCVEKGHGLMAWAMRIDPRYGITPNRHTERNGAHVVEYLGRPVQMWHCIACEGEQKLNWVVK